MTSDTDEPQRWSRGEVISLVLILLVATVLRFAWLDRHSLWFDEVITMRLALAPSLHSLIELLPRIDAVGAPLYPSILHVWSAWFGPSELAGRTLSALISVATVASVCWVGTGAFNRRAGLWCAWLVAVCPLEIQYAQEVRMYSLLGLFTCLCWGCLFSFRRSAPRWKQAAFAIGTIALVYTHSLGGLMVVALAVGYALDRPRSRLHVRSWVLIHLALAMTLAPWVSRYLDHAPDLKPVPRRWSEYMTWLQVFTGGRSITVGICLVLIVLGMFARAKNVDGTGRVGTGRGPNGRRALFFLDDLRTTLVILAWLALPPLILVVYSRLFHPIFGPARYFLFVGPAYLLLLARSLSKFDFRLSVGIALVGLMLAGPMIKERAYSTVGKPDWRGIARVIQDVDPSAPLVVCCDAPHIYYETAPYYLGPRIPVVPVRQHLETLSIGRVPRLTRCWFVSDQFDGIRPTPELMDRAYKPLREWRFGRLDLTYRAVEETAPPTTSHAAMQDKPASIARPDSGDVSRR